MASSNEKAPHSHDSRNRLFGCTLATQNLDATFLPAKLTPYPSLLKRGELIQFLKNCSPPITNLEVFDEWYQEMYISKIVC
jgi:hypothetical protein